MSSAVDKPCHVLLLIENETFPWDRRMRHFATALQQAGYRVSVICPKDDDFGRDSFEAFQGVRVYRYPLICQARGGLGYLIEYSWAFLCTTLLSVYLWVRHGVDIIHSANPPDIFFVLGWFFKLFGKKYIFDEHDVSPELYESKFKRRDWFYHLLILLQRTSYRVADLVISTNQSYQEIARERGKLPEERLLIVRNAVDTSYFHSSRPRSELKEPFTYMALYLGVMSKQDGVDRVLRAARQLVDTYGRRDVLFVMIGKGECWDELQELARELHVDDITRFTGRISDELLMEYLSTADVCLAPDPPDRMNQISTMTKILEYMAFGRPIVSFDLLESRRSAGDAAVYVEKDDPYLFAQAIQDLLNAPSRCEKMSRIGKDRTARLIGWDQARKNLLAAYSRLKPNRDASTCPPPLTDAP
jgi:glycosyltransferase involved in cell wall biosynthesis